MIEDLPIKIYVETPYNKTESFDKVSKAIKTIFFNADCKIENIGNDRIIYAELEGKKQLFTLFNTFRNQKVLDVARRMMFRGLLDNQFTIYFNKQAAFVEKIHFSLVDEETRILGPIKVTIASSNIEKVIDYLAPETVDGKIIEE